ncbi:MAG: DUF2752 domain-containing protein [Cyclobacteriaceae bacterium]
MISRFSLKQVLDIELMAWVMGLLILALAEPSHHQHFTLCPIASLGFDWCPGCGLGRSITFLFNGMLQESFEMHPLGGFALVMLIFRIYTLSKTAIKKIGL